MKKPTANLQPNRTIIGLLLLLSLIMLESCKESQVDNEEMSKNTDTLEARIEAVSSSPPTFSGRLDIYNNLMSLSDCADKFDSLTGPVNCSIFAKGLKDFRDEYNTASGTLNLKPSVVRLNSQLRQVIQRAVAGGHYGLVFHYGYDTVGDSLVYIMSRGQIYGEDTLISVCPFVNGDNEEVYLLMATHGGTGYVEIKQAAFTTYTTDYYSNVSKNGNPLSYSTDDPKMVYHRANGFAKFLAAFNSPNPTHLYIGHGAIGDVAAGGVKHVPLFALGDGQVFYTINDVIPSSGNVFRNKGLDIGRQCPPNCPTPVRTCN